MSNESLKARFAEVISSLNLGGMEAQEVSPHFNELLPAAQIGVAMAAKMMGVNSVSFFNLLGVPGGGKGTNVEAIRIASEKFGEIADFRIAPEPLRNLVTAFSGDMAAITTGTGGIFVPPKDSSDEYRIIFSSASQMVKSITSSGALVPDEVTSALVAFMSQQRIYAFGRPERDITIQVDVWPRTKAQYEHLLHQQAVLEKFDIKSYADLVYLVAVDKNILRRIEAEREAFAIAAETLGKYLKSGSVDILEAGREVADKDSPLSILIEEANLAKERIRARALTSGRADDSDASALINRLASYYLTAFDLLRIPSVRLVSSAQTPELVVKDLIEALVGDGLAQDHSLQEFVSLAQEEVVRIVNPG